MKTQKPDRNRVKELAEALAVELRKGVQRNGRFAAMTREGRDAYRVTLRAMFESTTGNKEKGFTTERLSDRDAFLYDLLVAAHFALADRLDENHVRAVETGRLIRCMTGKPGFGEIQSSFRYASVNGERRQRLIETERPRFNAHNAKTTAPPDTSRVC